MNNVWLAGTVHIPLHQLPAAMNMVSTQWLTSFDIPRPQFDDCIVVLSRGFNRAQWAAQIAKDAGFVHCLVYPQVHCHLMFDKCNVIAHEQ